MQLLTVDDLAELLSTTPQGVYNLRHRGAGPRALRLGKELRFRREDVDAWLDERVNQDTASDPRTAA